MKRQALIPTQRRRDTENWTRVFSAPRRLCVLGLAAFCVLLTLQISVAQFGRGSGEWSTTAADAQRSAWVRSDPKISVAGIQKGGFGLAWKLRLGNTAFSGDAVLLNGYIGYRGFRSLGYLADGGHIYAVDTDLGRLEWQKPLGAAVHGSGPCGGGITAGAARAVSTAFPPMPQAGRGPGRINPAKSAVGEPDEGAVTVRALAEREARMAAAAAAAPPPPRPAAAGAPPRRRPNYLHTISADGYFHSMQVSNGEEPESAVPFLPANTHATGLVVLQDTAYAVTAHGCGGAPNAVWALDLDSHAVTSWRASGDIAGAAGPAIAPDGTVYATDTSGKLAALGEKTLQPKSTYSAGAEFTSSPVLFQFHDQVLAAAAARDNRIHLLDTAAPGRRYEPQPAGFAPDALATWQDTGGTRWILASSRSAVTAWKLAEKDGAPALEPGWTSRDLASPGAPIIVNGVVFAFAAGSGSAPAALYAFDGTTGKELWNSGSTVTARGPASLSAAGMQVYLATHDGTFYAFGFPIEH